MARNAPWLLAMAFCGACIAATGTIELTDGTVVHGEVLSMANGRYVVQSPTLGRLEIEADRIRSIRSAGSPGGATIDAGELQSVQQRLLASPEIMDLITELQNDPELRAALADPAFMAAVSSGDVAALRSNPRLQRLMAHPTIRRILELVQQP